MNDNLQNMKLRFYGVRVTKKQMLIIEAVFFVLFSAAAAYFFIFYYRNEALPEADRESGLYYFLLFVFFDLWVIIEAQFFFNRFTVAYLNHIEIQKNKIEAQKKEITDSINYARRIQTAIFPPIHLVKESLKDSFILYKPKDVVAGDFYWLEKKEGKILFAVADCTGHGVPGAMVSVICNDSLNRAVREYGLCEPAKILDKVRVLVLEEFMQSDEEVKDGMDIALCLLDGYHLKFAGANNPLWIIRNGELLETKGDKQPVGRFDNYNPFKCHSFRLEKGDILFLFSDGFVDQFGGEKCKKFKAKAFRSLLMGIRYLPMEEQRVFIEKTFDDWKGKLEQIDDVCVMGVRVD